MESSKRLSIYFLVNFLKVGNDSGDSFRNSVTNHWGQIKYFDWVKLDEK